MDRHYDLIIIGTGAGGGTIAHELAPTGKKILILERGDFLPRERKTGVPKKFIKTIVTIQRAVVRSRWKKPLIPKLAIGWEETPRFMVLHCCRCGKEILKMWNTRAEFLQPGD